MKLVRTTGKTKDSRGLEFKYERLCNEWHCFDGDHFVKTQDHVQYLAMGFVTETLAELKKLVATID